MNYNFCNLMKLLKPCQIADKQQLIGSLISIRQLFNKCSQFANLLCELSQQKQESDCSSFGNVNLGLILKTFILITLSTIASPTIIPTSLEGQALTSYTLFIFDSVTNVRTGSTIRIKFPNRYSAQILYSNSPYSGNNATLFDFCPSSCASVTIQYSAYTFTLNNMFPIPANPILQYSINGIRNPLPGSTSGFTIQIIDPNGTVVYTETPSAITFQPATLSVTGQAILPQIWAISPLTLTISPTQLNVDSLRVTIPSTWPNQKRQASTLSSPVSCISSTHPTLRCQQISQNLQVLNINPSYGNISPTTISLTILSIYNPSVVMNLQGITVTTYDINGVSLQASSNLLIGGLQNSTLRHTTVSISSQTASLCTVLIITTFPRTSIAGDQLSIVFPSQLAFGASPSVLLTVGGVSVSGNVNINSGQRRVTIEPFSSITLQATVGITVSGVLRPHGALNTGNFILSTIRTTSLNSIMDYIACCSVKFSPDQTLTANIIPSSNANLATGVTYSFNINVQLSLVTSDVLIIEFDSKYYPNVQSTTSCVSFGTSTSAPINTNPTCVYLTGTKLRVSNILLSNTFSPHSFTLTINGVTNPTFPSNPQFVIYTYSTEPIEINPANMVSMVIQSATINSFTVTPSSSNVGQRGVSYNLNIGGLGSLQIGYLIEIQIPTQILLNLNTPLACKINSVDNHCYTLRDGTNRVFIKVQSNSLGVLSSVAIQNVMNPISLKPTAIFQLKVTSNSIILEEESSSISATVTMTNPSQFSAVIVYPEIVQVSSTAVNNKLMIQAISPFSLARLGLFSMQMQFDNTGFLFGSAVSCESSYTSFGCTFINNATGLFIVVSNIDLNGGSTALDSIQFNITSLLLLKSNPWINLKIADSNGFASLTQNMTVSNISLISNQLSYTLTQSNYQMSQLTSISLSYTLPASVIFNSSTVQIAYTVITVPEQYNPNTAINTTNLTLPLTFALTNPAIPTSGVFRVSLYSSANKLIAISSLASQSTYRFALSCNLPCKSCSAANKSSCLSCYSILQFQYLDNITNQCLDHCGSYAFTNSTTGNKFCLPCNIQCLRCQSTDRTLCTSCSSPRYFYSINSSCVVNCPDTYYASSDAVNRVCLKCEVQCKVCISLQSCTQCQPGFYLFNNSKCLLSCPPKTVASLITNVCIDCSSNCLSCNSSECLGCSSNYYLHLGQCISTCPLGLYPSYEQKCAPCDCQQCSLHSYNCTSCFQSAVKNKFLQVQNICLANCPDGTYAGSDNICQNCQVGCVLCSVNSSNCNRCAQNYYYYRNSCLLNCPDGTLATLTQITNISLGSKTVSSCESCAYPCQTCAYSRTFCLSCIIQIATTYYFYENVCVSSCPPSYHPFSFDNGTKNLCQKCSLECLSCIVTDPYNCTECVPGHFLLNNTCFGNCPAKYYAEITSKQCLDCYFTCATCVNGTNCTTCISGYFLFNWLCYTSCPAIPVKYYEHRGSCTLCQPQCTSCISSPIQCTSCASNIYLHNPITHQCTYNCTPPYYQNGDGTLCVPCSAPCLTCDHAFSACKTCNSSIYVLYAGTCISECPSGYYRNSSINQCLQCQHPCLQCLQTKCTVCQPYAFLVGKRCLLECPPQLSFQADGYCTSCLSIQYCAICDQTKIDSFTCYQCAAPYVLFYGQCLNSCPTNYSAEQRNSSSVQNLTYLICVQSAEYIHYLSELDQFNRPVLPPFTFFNVALVLCTLLGLISLYKIYPHTYLVGYFIGIYALADFLILWYYWFYMLSRYQGQKVAQSGTLQIQLGKSTPINLLFAGIILSLALNLLYLIAVVFLFYLNDIRYRQWKSQRPIFFAITVVPITIICGPRGHKLFYSKLFGWDCFSYRILSVQKFYLQDAFIFLQIFLADSIELIAVIIVAYNVNMGLNLLFLCALEIILIKALLWTLLTWDLRKKDIGFFKGDQQWAEQEQQKILLQQSVQRKQIELQSLVKLIRTKSAGQLLHTLDWQLDENQFISQYDPNDYQDVIKVPTKRIQKYIYRGKFRKGKKITIQEKLKKFADYHKPAPKLLKKQEDVYLRKLIYWRPPKALKVRNINEDDFTIQQPSEQNLLHLLQEKQFLYKDELEKIQLPSINNNGSENRQNKNNERYRQDNFLDDLDQTIPNETLEHFYPSMESNNKDPDFSLDYDDLMNLNYARRRHLVTDKKELEQQQHQQRLLHHQPRRKRNRILQRERQTANREKDKTINRQRRSSSKGKQPKSNDNPRMGRTMAGFGNMVMRNIN